MTIVIVTLPRNILELRYCLASYRRFGPSDLKVILITEPEHLKTLAGLLPKEDIRAMGEEEMSIPNGYFRQQAAKIFSYRHTADCALVITDDDTEAVQPYSFDTFFCPSGRAKVYFRLANGMNRWAHGNARLFQRTISRTYQLLLPFAVLRESLENLATSDIGSRALELWRRGVEVSEFEAIGEWCYLHEQSRAKILTLGDHWTVDRVLFRDWQCYRRSLRRKISNFSSSTS